MNEGRNAEPPAPRQIAAATAIAFLVAGALLIAVVLPAEYGIDMIGTGRMLGLTALAGPEVGAVTSQTAAYKVDAREFALSPFESVEYKYRLEEGASMVFSWEATGIVVADLHSEPDNGPEGYAESFDRRESSAAHGTYRAPFTGIHGWFWENRGRTDLTIRLRSGGFYTAAQEFRDGDSVFHQLTDLASSAPGTSAPR
jgi:hypothetical protein